MKTIAVIGLACLWSGTITSRPGLVLLGAVILTLLAPVAIAGLRKEVRL